MNTSVAGLAELIHPVGVADFFENSWGRKPLHVPRDDRAHYKGLFSADDLDDILRFSAPVEKWRGKVRMAIKYLEVPEEALFEKETPGFDYRTIRKSAAAVSLIFNYLQQDNNRIYRLARQLEQDLEGRISGRVNVNAYLSPGRSYIGLHRDTHDELNLQVSGNKRWRVYASDVRLPYYQMPLDQRSRPRTGSPSGQGQEPIMEIVLREGEFLYMPRGLWHDPVNTDDGPSLGLTIGVAPLCWLDVLHFSARAAAGRHEELRGTLPQRLGDESEEIMRHGRRLCHQLPDWSSLPDTVVDARRDASDDTRPEEILCPTEAELAGLQADSKLTRPPGAPWTCNQICGLVRLKANNRETGLRSELNDVVEYIRDTPSFQPAELPGDLTSGEKVRLCRFLMNVGAIQFESRLS